MVRYLENQKELQFQIDNQLAHLKVSQIIAKRQKEESL
jgi:hypothetical protein